MTEYQPRTSGRLVELLLAQDENPRSWQHEAAARITELEAERDRLANRLDLLAVGFGVCDGGKYIADWQAKIAHFKCALAAESDLSRVRDELDTSNNNHRAMAHQMAELGAHCKHAESELSRVEGETIERCAQCIQDGVGMADIIDQELLDEQARILRSLPPLAKRGDQKSHERSNPPAEQSPTLPQQLTEN